jgi:prepilin-type N-terminal cleavage/methylation domain-containing protein/prepilin-type processing-associated H-X9-DG protein
MKMKKKGFTLIELLVVIAIIAMLLAILMPALNKVKKIAQRVVCGTNLKGLGTAQSVYANDYEDQFAKQGGSAVTTWAPFFAGWQAPNNPWIGASPPAGGNATVSASLYLLIREADVSPKSFVCTASGQTAYDGRNANNRDLVELWDFGSANAGADAPNSGPKNCVSYAYQDPYGSYAASGTATASFAMMADKNPWYDSKIAAEIDPASVTAETYSGQVARLSLYWTGIAYQKYQIQVANAYAHAREGQNVLFGDGHANYEKEPDVGVRHDNIYTVALTTPTANNSNIRCGITALGTYTFKAAQPVTQVDPAGGDDSFLINDDDNP